MTRPWLRQYRDERGTFAQLSLVTRGLFREILGLTNDDGVIQLAGRSPLEAICFALGATRADRRALRTAIPELLADGCLVLRGDTLVAPNFARFQGDVRGNDGATTEPRPCNEPTTTEQRPNHDRATKVDLSVRNDVLAQNVLLRSEKSRVEESRVDAQARVTPQLDERVSFADAQDAFSRLRVEHGGGPFRAQMRDHAKVTELADFATSTGKTRAERVAVLEAVVRGYLASADQWCIDRGYPVSGMHDFGVLLARGRRVRPKDDPESPIAKVRAEMAQLLPYYEGKKREKDVEAHSLKERRYVELQAELRALQRAEREQAERGAA